MLPEICPEEYAAALDVVANQVLTKADWGAPPIDAVQVAARLRVEIAYDPRQSGRARRVRLQAGLPGTGVESILLRPEPRPERMQWAVAHELGEIFAHQVFAEMGVDPREVPNGARESIANQLAGRILLPATLFFASASECQWDLVELKNRFKTASHELIARRMLDSSLWTTITIFDQGRMTFRRCNRYRRRPPLIPAETSCRREVDRTGQPQVIENLHCRVQGWPVNEPDWQREILRTETMELCDVVVDDTLDE